jgi:membrane protease YdiL (CAAX protease family)
LGKLLVDLFWNRADRRLRAFWRILIQGFAWFSLITALTFFILIAFTLAEAAGGRLDLQDMTGSVETILDLMYQPVGLLIIQAVTFLITLGTVWLAGRFLDRRPFADFGFHFSRMWWLDLAFGLFLGAFLMTGAFLLELAAGWVSVTGYGVSSVPGVFFPLALLIPILMFLCAGISEEMFSRGYQLKNLSEGLNSRRFGPVPAVLAATVLSSIFFGCLHLGNPNMSLISLVNLMSAGVFLALGYILTGELAVSIGLHIAWNFFQGNVFGFPVSGLDPIAARLLAIRQSGPEWMTGGAFGPEGGLIGLGAMVTGCVMIILWAAATRRKIALARSLSQSPGKTAEPAE